MKLAVLILFCLLTATTAYSLNGEEILQKSDNKLVPKECTYDLALETSDTEDNNSIQKFKGFKKGNNKNLLLVKEPKKIAGSAHLRKGDVIWSYFTTNRKLTKMAYQSIFMGTLLNYGDILATELSLDYVVSNVAIVGTDYSLTLAPKKGKEAYAKIIITIDKKSLLPKNRKYFAISGLLLKECNFKEIKYSADSNLTYLEMEFFEPIKNKKTLVKFTNIVIKTDIADKYYNENFIEHLGQ